MKRLFNRVERIALLKLAGYKCEECGVAVDINTMEADHVIPYSDNGQTVMTNAQCLCKPCNRRKSNMNKYYNIASRKWQVDAFNQTVDMVNEGKNSVLISACPGAGKTRYGVALTTWAFDNKLIDRVVIIAPRSKIASQWREGLGEHKIKLVTGLEQKHMEEMVIENDVDTAGKKGVVMTYSMSSYKITQEYLTALARRYRVLFIFDEVHWNSDLNNWGRGIKTAAENAKFSVALSGTPWRDDNIEIPFINYTDGEVSAKIGIEYGEAITNSEHYDEYGQPIVRPCEFYHTGGYFKAVRASDGEELFFDYADGDYEGDEKQMNDRLRYSLLPESPWWFQLMDDAHARLMSIRRHHKNAGGIVFCMNQKHAEAVRDYMDRVHRVRATVVTSKEGNGEIMIDRFAASRKEWLISVKMVSEGVDIPRLRVAAFVQNVTTEKNFQQCIARCLRVDYDAGMPAFEQMASVFMPDDPRFAEYAKKFLQPCEAVLGGDRRVKICPECGEENTIDAKKCHCCDYEWPTTKDCPECGTTVPKSARVCPECGYEWVRDEDIITVTEAEPVPEGATIAGAYIDADELGEAAEVFDSSGVDDYWVSRMSDAEKAKIMRAARNGDFDRNEL